MQPINEIATVSGWRSTQSNRLQLGSFGLRLGRKLRDRWVDSGSHEIQLQLEGVPGSMTVTLSAAFWHKCPEFKHGRIGHWIQSQELPLPWPSRQPYQFEMHRIGRNSFRVLRRTRDQNNPETNS